MGEKSVRNGLFILGLIIAIASLSLAFLEYHHWYYGAVVGILFVFDYLATQKNYTTTLQLCTKDRKKAIALYVLLFALGIVIEVIGRYWLHWWTLPYLTPQLEVIGFMLYPFILASCRETYACMRRFSGKITAFILSMIVGIVIWEIPNLFSGDWIYTVPITTMHLFRLNVIVILGWSLLIFLPLYVYSLIFRSKIFN